MNDVAPSPETRKRIEAAIRAYLRPRYLRLGASADRGQPRLEFEKLQSRGDRWVYAALRALFDSGSSAPVVVAEMELIRSGHDWRTSTVRHTAMSKEFLPMDLETAAFAHALRRWQPDGAATLFDPPDRVVKELQRTWPRARHTSSPGHQAIRSFFIRLAWRSQLDTVRTIFSGPIYLRIERQLEAQVGRSLPEITVVRAERRSDGWRFRDMSSAPLPRAARSAVASYMKMRGTGGSRSVSVISEAEYRKRAAEFDRRGYCVLGFETNFWSDPDTVYVSVYTRSHPPGNDVSYEKSGNLRLSRDGKRWVVFDLQDWAGE